VASLAFLKPENITAKDDYTVVFKTDQPVAELPTLIVNKNALIVPDGATTESLKFTGNGTGPWIAVDFKPAAQPHKFVKNPNYWEPGLPKASCLEFYAVSEGTTRTALIQSGQVDIAVVDNAIVPTLQKKHEPQAAENADHRLHDHLHVGRQAALRQCEGPPGAQEADRSPGHTGHGRREAWRDRRR